MQKTNVNGSGISLGHPIGATGAVLVVKLMEEMNLNNHLFGGVSLCVGGGQGIASIFENVQNFKKNPEMFAIHEYQPSVQDTF